MFQSVLQYQPLQKGIQLEDSMTSPHLNILHELKRMT
jgi:hypothetical protein